MTSEHLQFVIMVNLHTKAVFDEGIYYMMQCGRKYATTENFGMFCLRQRRFSFVVLIKSGHKISSYVRLKPLLRYFDVDRFRGIFEYGGKATRFQWILETVGLIVDLIFSGNARLSNF